MDYSLNLRKMSVGTMKGKELFIASPVCQKQRVSFEKLCERMAEDTTYRRRGGYCSRILQVS